MIRIEVSTHSGAVDVVEVENYDSFEMAEDINDNDIQVLAIGQNIYSRIDIKNIKPLIELIIEPPESE